MPAEYFSFKPTSDVRSYAEIFGHIIDTNYYACAALRGEANPSKDELEKTLKTKDDVVKAVKASFDYCDGAMKTLSEATLERDLQIGHARNPENFALAAAHRAQPGALRQSGDLHALERGRAAEQRTAAGQEITRAVAAHASHARAWK